MTDVIVRSDSGLSQSIEVGEHRLTADEPVTAGGSDSGPNPYELLLSALGTCTAITVRLYAQRKQWPLQSIQVVLHHDRIHADDCAECETKQGFLDQITKSLTFLGPLDADQRRRLAEIAELCPVQRTLMGEVRIVQRLVDPAD